MSNLCFGQAKQNEGTELKPFALICKLCGSLHF